MTHPGTRVCVMAHFYDRTLATLRPVQTEARRLNRCASGGPHPPTHRTIFPTNPYMLYDMRRDRLFAGGLLSAGGRVHGHRFGLVRLLLSRFTDAAFDATDNSYCDTERDLP